MNDLLDKELKEIEAQLSNLKPLGMPDDMISRMEQAMISWENTTEDEGNIVPFNHTPSTAPAEASQRSSSKIHIWSAAAAIALLAGVIGVFSSTPDQSAEPTNLANNMATPATITDDADYTPIQAPQLSRNIVNASNEGVTFANDSDEAYKVLRIEYTEKSTTRDKNGNTVITEKPCVDHVLVPVPVH